MSRNDEEIQHVAHGDLTNRARGGILIYLLGWLVIVGEVVRMTCSIGGASVCPDFHENRENLLKQADQALYLAKDLGRNQYRDGSTGPLRATGNA